MFNEVGSVAVEDSVVHVGTDTDKPGQVAVVLNHGWIKFSSYPTPTEALKMAELLTKVATAQ